MSSSCVGRPAPLLASPVWVLLLLGGELPSRERALRAPVSCCMADISGERSQNVLVVLEHAPVQSLSKTYAGNCCIENLLETTRAEDRTRDMKEGDDVSGPFLGNLGGFHRK